MKRNAIVAIALCLFGVSALLSQTVSVEPFGVSPRDADADVLDIFNPAYNGLLNVGVETQMYLKGFSSTRLITPTWTVLSAPYGSVATITTLADMDTSTQIAHFTPDVKGKYTVEFADGTVADTIKINAGTYMGIETGLCWGCHTDITADWEETGHYSIFEDGLNGVASSRYSTNCIGCHTTGFDADAENEGFDDREFVFPDTLREGQFDNMMLQYPDAMKLARIQCESCHGPASAHNVGGLGLHENSEMVKTLDAANCAWCHDSGTHHVFPAQWDVSRHGNPLYAARGSRTSCAPCHSGSGFVAWMKGGQNDLTEAPSVTAITCATCHDPHSAENAHQLRTVDDVTLGNNEVVSGGLGNLCMNCHKSRRNAEEYTGPDFSYSSHYGPHHGPQADMLFGKNVPTFGEELPVSAHFAAVENACVGCHMWEDGKADGQGNVILVGNHTFSMVDQDGTDNVAVCEECHGFVGEEFGEKKYYYNGWADHDGDGTAEGLKDEIEGLLDILAWMLPPYDTLEVVVDDPYVYTETMAKAAYNYFFVEEDRSHGVHNPAFAITLLDASIRALGGYTGVVLDEAAGIPTEFTLGQNFPNPFNPQTLIQYRIPETSEVKLAVYSILGEEINTLVDERQAAGSYVVTWDGTDNFGMRLSSGIYFYRIQAGNFTEMKKMILVK